MGWLTRTQPQYPARSKHAPAPATNTAQHAWRAPQRRAAAHVPTCNTSKDQ